jgi:hypothetical protein
MALAWQTGNPCLGMLCPPVGHSNAENNSSNFAANDNLPHHLTSVGAG